MRCGGEQEPRLDTLDVSWGSPIQILRETDWAMAEAGASGITAQELDTKVLMQNFLLGETSVLS